MICPWVELEKDQYKRLKELEENTGKGVSEVIREAITSFVTNKDYSISIGASYLPRKARENYRRVTTYLSRSNLSLLASISKETGRCKTHLIREAVDNYLGSTAVPGKRGRQPSNDDGLFKNMLLSQTPKAADLEIGITRKILNRTSFFGTSSLPTNMS